MVTTYCLNLKLIVVNVVTNYLIHTLYYTLHIIKYYKLITYNIKRQ